MKKTQKGQINEGALNALGHLPLAQAAKIATFEWHEAEMAYDFARSNNQPLPIKNREALRANAEFLAGLVGAIY